MLAACSENLQVGYDVSAGGTGGSSVGVLGGAANAGTGGSGTSGGQSGGCTQRTCQGKLYACGDCIDNDGDGLVDADDPDCVGPCDNTEDSFFGGIPGQNNAPCRQDCYFDQDSGSGNDRCDWTDSCDPLSVAPSYPPSGDANCAYDPNASIQGNSCASLLSAEPQACLDFCLPLTPNGCDCFGCCELPARSHHYVWLGSMQNGAGSCDRAHVDDPSACAPCTPVPSCFNPCDACEVCVGTTLPDAGCNGVSCAQGSSPCSLTLDCPSDSYCITGCCEPVPR